jgi:hypothetical protein
MILVPLFDLKFLFELAAGDVGTSNRRHSVLKHAPIPRNGMRPKCLLRPQLAMRNAGFAGKKSQSIMVPSGR